MVKKLSRSSNESAKSKKNKKQKRNKPEAVAMKLKAQKTSNPFETIWSRRKFDILGKKRKGEERRVGLARSQAIEKRKKTLLKDYEQSGKSSVFLDKRIGEQNEELGEFDKAIMRSQRERQLKLGKKSKYNLSDGEEDDFDNEDGSIFGSRDDFEDEVPLDEDDAEATESEKRFTILKQLSAGHQNSLTADFEGEETRKKSKKEVMAEIISKSKFFKEQKAKDKDENEELIQQLDQRFTSLVQSEALLSLTQPAKMNALKALVNKSNIKDNAKVDTLPAAHIPSEQEKPDVYDKLVNEMILDMRARPSERTKTPEEIAAEEKKQLQELEEERQKRMLSNYDSSDDDDKDDALKDKNASLQKLKSTSGDYLGDSFHDEEPKTKLGWIHEILKKENEDGESPDNFDSTEDGENEDEDEDDDDEEEEEEEEEEDGGGGGGGGGDSDSDSDEDTIEGEKVHSLKDWEHSDDDNIDTDLEEGEGKEEELDDLVELKGLKKAVETGKKKKDGIDGDEMKQKVKQFSNKQRDLPYTIEAPKSLEEFQSLLENRSDDDIVEAIRRIRAFNAIKIAPENRKKMQVFYGVLLQYFAVSANKKPLNFKLLNLLVKPLMEMSVEIPYFAAICARHRLLQIRSQFSENVKTWGTNSWPSIKTLFLLRLWSMIFPCSDFRHVVMTPAILLMCEYLMRCPILCGRDVAIGSFLCSMVLSVSKQSRKFCPEAIEFLKTLLMAAFDKKPDPSQDSQLYHLLELKAPRPLLCINGGVDDISPLDFLKVMDSSDDSSYFSSENFRASMLVAVIETLRGFVNIYDGLSSFPEIFLPLSKLLVELAEQKNMPKSLQDSLRDVSQLIETKAHDHQLLRRPLQMRKQKPVPIKLFNPKFEENFVKGRDYDPDRERAERRKLRKLYKAESKGAARELRKDNHFLSMVKEKENSRAAEERAEKYGKARAFLQEQEHAFKSGQLGKGRKRRK